MNYRFDILNEFLCNRLNIRMICYFVNINTSQSEKLLTKVKEGRIKTELRKYINKK